VTRNVFLRKKSNLKIRKHQGKELREMLKKKNCYTSPEIEITAFEVSDIVTSSATASGADTWLGSDGNVDTGGWT
jgi:hypothetical protein